MDCIFCKIIKKEIPTDFLYEDDNFVVFNDIKPDATFHALIVPKKHVKNLFEIDDNASYWGEMLIIAKKIANDHNLGEGFRMVINNGKLACQIVEHLHCHILGGNQLSSKAN